MALVSSSPSTAWAASNGPEVPAGKARLLVMVEEQAEGSELPEAKVESVDGRLRLVLPQGTEIDWDQVSVKRSRDERTKNLLGMG